MAGATASAPKGRRGGAAAVRSRQTVSPAKPRPVSGKAAAPAMKRAATTTTPPSTKEELRLRVEKLERANAMLRVKNKELRMAYVTAAEQADQLTIKLESAERRAERRARQEGAQEQSPSRGGRVAAARAKGRKPRATAAGHGAEVAGQSDEGEADLLG